MSLKERKIETNIDYCINSEEDLLLYTLFSLKSGLTYDLLGLVSGMDGSNAKRNQNLGLELLGKTLFHLIDLYDDILGICAGLWNFYLTNV